jgi:phage-related protein
MAWTVEVLEIAQPELDALPSDMRAKYIRIADLIEANGPMNVREPYVKSLERGLYEIRMTGKDGIARAIYVTAKERRVVVLVVFVKKTQKTPQHVLELARKRSLTVT